MPFNKYRKDLDTVVGELANKFGLDLMSAGSGLPFYGQTLSHALVTALHEAYCAGLEGAYSGIEKHINWCTMHPKDMTSENRCDCDDGSNVTVIIHENE
jgi:hypothetical protein